MRTSATALGLLLMAGLGVFASCTKSPPADQASPVERHISDPYDVRIFTMLPECEYVQTGSVEGRGCDCGRAGRHLRELAWRGGGDAIIHVVTYDTEDRIRGCRRGPGCAMRGVAIRFTDPECMH